MSARGASDDVDLDCIFSQMQAPCGATEAAHIRQLRTQLCYPARGGHMARLAAADEPRLLTAVLGLRDATRREAMRGLLCRSSDPDRHRLGTIRMGRPRARWEDHIQDTCKACTSVFTQDEDVWDAMGNSLRTQACAHQQRPAEISRGRWMIAATP